MTCSDEHIKITVQIVQEHLSPKPVVIAERFNYDKQHQHEWKSICSFTKELKILSKASKTDCREKLLRFICKFNTLNQGLNKHLEWFLHYSMYFFSQVLSASYHCWKWATSIVMDVTVPSLYPCLFPDFLFLLSISWNLMLYYPNTFLSPKSVTILLVVFNQNIVLLGMDLMGS